MKVLNYFDSDRQEHWLGQIQGCDWRAGKLLYEWLRDGRFFKEVGRSSKLLLLTEEDRLLSFCTYAEKDDIQPTERSPWIGFVYTFPPYRGHRYVALLFEEVERIARAAHVPEVYISTDHIGLYEKYGCSFLCMMDDRHGNPSRVYVKHILET